MLAVSVVLFFFVYLLMLLFADICSLSLAFSFCGAAEKIGVSWKLRQPDTEDPLLAGIKLKIGPGSSLANSPRADADVRWVVAEEEGRDAS
jgi:hypothetical protein